MLRPSLEATFAETFRPISVEPVAEISGTRLSLTSVSAISSLVPITRLNTPSGTLFPFMTFAMIRCRAIEHRGVLGLGFQIETFPQTAAIMAFHDQTATGKLKAEIMPTIPSGWYWSYMRCPGRSECMVEP